MIKIVEEYISDKSESKVATELISSFKSSKMSNNIKKFSIQSIDLLNFGNLSSIEHTFKKDMIITGDREQGKSWFAEAPLWCLTNKCRTVAQVSGNGGNVSNSILFTVGTKK